MQPNSEQTNSIEMIKISSAWEFTKAFPIITSYFSGFLTTGYKYNVY